MHRTLQFNDLHLDLPVIFEEIGYKTVLPDIQTATLTGRLLEEASAATVPQFQYIISDGKVDDTTVFLDNGAILHTGKVISHLLHGAKRFAIFAATAGEAFGIFQKQTESDGDIVKSFIVNAIGTCIVEKTGDYMERSLESQLKGEKHTARYSPGYCGWNLTGQRELFSILGDTPCAIQLTADCLMLPLKSVSGIIGIGDNVTEKQYGCQFCELTDCYKKKN